MRALVKSRAERGLWLEDVPEPKPGINDVLIRVLMTGICGTDLHIYEWNDWAKATIPVPLVIGHEFVGEIVEVGSNVTDFRLGEIVGGEGHVVCGRCRNCLAGRRHLCAHTLGLGVQRPGAFAEYVVLPMSNVWRHRQTVPLEVAARLEEISRAGLFKKERVIETPQQARVGVSRGVVLNLCANNYLGLANHPEVVKAARDALARWGFGMASVRFICGTQTIHKELEQRLSEFLGTEDAILYNSCFDANGGLFEALLDERDAVISDELNHASIIDGVRLCKAQRFRYRNSDMEELEARLQEAAGARHILIATDGVFSMDGYIARLPEICDAAERHGAMVMVDDSHAVGFLGRTGRGTPEHHNVLGRVDILTGTLGKALGGACGGYTAARKEVVALLRQRSRPYLFSNSLPPAIAATTLKVLDLVTQSAELRQKLRENTAFFRRRMTELGFQIQSGEHPIVPVMIGDAARAVRLADLLLAKGIYVVAFSYPVVPKDKARIRVQVSASHSREDLEFAAEMFAQARAELDARP